jgi:hypothetical protein
MKNVNFNNHLKGKIFPVFIALLMTFFLSACAKKVTFPDSPVVPGADGYVKVKEDNNDNYEIEVNVTHLAAPERLSPPKKVYVVWMETEATRIENIGQLNISSGLFSNTRKGSLETVTSYKPSEVFITAEDDSNIQYPGRQVVLRANVD